MALPEREDLDPATQQIYDQPGTSMAFTITRKRVQTGLTFSSEAFEAYLGSIQTWIATRMMRHWYETGEPPTVMDTVVMVNIDHGDPEKIVAGRVPADLLDQALRLCETVIETHEHVGMDTPEDKALHAKACETYRERLELIKAHRDGKTTRRTDIQRRPEDED